VLLRALNVIKSNHITYLLAVGGGSVIDGTKFLSAAALYQGEEPWDILKNKIRFYKKHDAKYRILENRSLVIYEFQRPGDKQTGFKPLLSYYYSEGVDGEVYPLTIDNLKRTFKEQAAFDIIDANFKTDQDLVSYDTYNHMFRINRLLARI
ncbi:hypothetical protein TH53_22625, partial [Pedobacter lusitanus]